MSQTLLLSVSIPFFLFGCAALWPSVNLAPGLTEKRIERELEARQKLIAAALRQLKLLRVTLDSVFAEYDDGNDPFLRKVQPQAVLGPVREYVRLLTLESRMTAALTRAQKLSRLAFWFLASFVLSIFATTVLGVLVPQVGSLPGTLALLLAGVCFTVGGGIYAATLLYMRSVDSAHLEVGEIARSSVLPDESSESR